jgi:hypothetical protein
MAMRLNLRRWLLSSLVVAILFAQVAVSAHACPMNGAPQGAADAASAAAMPCAEMGMALDSEAPGLCQQHCQYGNTQQTADPAQALTLPPVVLALAFVLEPAPPAGVSARAWAVHAIQRDSAPPHSVLHCCYRL